MICASCIVVIFSLVCFLYPSCLLAQVAVPDVTQHPNWNLLEHENCGISMTDRIIGGTNASLGQFPWLARIGYTSDDQRSASPNFKCGGALINKIYVLTAAHCVTSLPGKFIVSSVRLGENNALTEIDCEGQVCAARVQDFKPRTLIVHKDYGVPPYKNDIALIRLDRPALFNGWVQPICIPFGVQLAQSYEGAKAEVAGWGVYDMNNPRASNYLLYVSLPVVNLNRCVVAFKKHAKIGPTQLCVGGVIGEDSCGGDSGGPLVKGEAAHGVPRYYILGVVSFGAKHCGATTMPAIYTRMASYVVWVLDNILP
ncbi:hypothetical protein ILUMI_00843 [Ignelater luminosus]|uniref:Peptidase S1 domain-containing protein n=1 Tax=Ignelater luminosus TaxID=2038154 RepID=A0A8K0GMS0_IGNLU|nr:hypothetical protein ILUMI_00843 [Ignelater luminosus]